MKPYRDEVETLEQNGITKVAFKRLDDPKVIPLWFGEGDTVTPDFIRDATKEALDRGETFYCHTRGRPELRGAIKTYLDRLYGISVDERRITARCSADLAPSDRDGTGAELCQPPIAPIMTYRAEWRSFSWSLQGNAPGVRSLVAPTRTCWWAAPVARSTVARWWPSMCWPNTLTIR